MQKITVNGQEFEESVLIPNYFVSRTGEVYGRNVSHTDELAGTNEPRLIAMSLQPAGYQQVGLFDEKRWCWRTFRVHRLVATQFLQNPDGKFYRIQMASIL